MAKPKIDSIPTVALFTKLNEKTTLAIKGSDVSKGDDVKGTDNLQGEYKGKIKKGLNAKNRCVAEIKCEKEHNANADIDEIEITITNSSSETSDPVKAEAVNAS